MAHRRGGDPNCSVGNVASAVASASARAYSRPPSKYSMIPPFNAMNATHGSSSAPVAAVRPTVRLTKVHQSFAPLSIARQATEATPTNNP